MSNLVAPLTASSHPTRFLVALPALEPKSPTSMTLLPFGAGKRMGSRSFLPLRAGERAGVRCPSPTPPLPSLRSKQSVRLKCSIQNGTKTKIFQRPNPPHQQLPSRKIARSSQIPNRPILLPLLRRRRRRSGRGGLILVLRRRPQTRPLSLARPRTPTNAMASWQLHSPTFPCMSIPIRSHSPPVSVHRPCPDHVSNLLA